MKARSREEGTYQDDGGMSTLRSRHVGCTRIATWLHRVPKRRRRRRKKKEKEEEEIEGRKKE